ncbi:MAG: hypothetical protein ACE5L6_06980 [Candidatus Bathyarchaeia archaeon]
MSRKLSLIILASGLIATLTSGLYPQDLSIIGASITGYGLPLSWLSKVMIIYPSSPTRHSFSLESFVLDVLFWSLIATLLVVVMAYRRSVLKLLHKTKE